MNVVQTCNITDNALAYQKHISQANYMYLTYNQLDARIHNLLEKLAAKN